MSINWDNVEFKDDNRFLSNMYPCKVVIDGITYNSSENYYMSMKFKYTDPEKAEALRECTPLESKKLANNWSDYIQPDWDSVKKDVMRKALAAKFTQNQKLADLLLATGDSHLEERNDWNDVYWGTYLGKGQNHLGKLLMEQRNSLREAEDA